jgi:glycosyltransferase involved in cell wall biosynthesis
MTIITFVTPWYGPDAPGGAEAETRRLVGQLQRAGVAVEVLTTTTRDLYADWGRDYFPAGTTTVDGVPVRRFAVGRRNRAAFDAVNARLMAGRAVSAADERVYIEQMIRVPALYEFMAREAAGRLYVFIPYLFATTYYGAQVCPERSIIIPCLHDESYARLGLYREVLPRARALVFHTEAERALADRLFPGPAGQIREVLGEGVDTDATGDGDRFRRRYGLDGPFVLYAGRREPGKNTPLLLDLWARYWRGAGRGRGARLVLLGPGDITLPAGAAEGFLDLGFVPAQEKLDAYAAADLFCLPSVNESFSIALMESWLAETPALVHAGCAVTVEHCRHANGGLYFADHDEFAATLDYLFDYPAVAARMGRNGRAYVLARYQWPAIIPRYRDLFAHVKKETTDYTDFTDSEPKKSVKSV